MLWILRLTLRRLLIVGVLMTLITGVMTAIAPTMPSGWLVYYATTESSAAYWQVHLMDIDRRVSFPINDNVIYSSEPAIAPDGRFAVVSGSMGLLLADLQTGAFETIGEGHHAIWNPDDTQVAYGGRWSTLVIYQVAGVGLGEHLTESKRIASIDLGEDFIPVAWSPDGQYIAVHTYDSLLVVDPLQATVIYRMSVATGEHEVITGIEWSPDGRALAYGVTDIETSNSATVNIALLQSAETITLLEGLENVEWLVWSPNRLGPSRLAVIYRQGSNTPLRVLTLSPDYRAIGDDLLVPINSRQVQWSPDGRRLLFISRREADIFAVDAIGSNLRRITDNDKYNVLLR